MICGMIAASQYPRLRCTVNLTLFPLSVDSPALTVVGFQTASRFSPAHVKTQEGRFQAEKAEILPGDRYLQPCRDVPRNIVTPHSGPEVI